MKLVLEDGREVALDYAGSTLDGDEVQVMGFDTDHPDILSVTLNLPRSDAGRIAAELGLGEPVA
ncbi:MAG: hypothetical protein HZT43_01360 [Exiguobacterium profundum]|nr:MAG: hypothetical protein HZT43_01360 [Exiguobacterium profundum]